MGEEEERQGSSGVRLVPPLQSGPQTVHSVNNIHVNCESSASDLENTLSDNEAHNLSLLADAAIAQLGLAEPYPGIQVSKKSLLPLVPLYKGGNISCYVTNWEKLTSDVNIISIVKYGLTLRTREKPRGNKPHAYGCSELEQTLLTQEINSLVKKRIIIPSDIQSGDYFSPVFLPFSSFFA